MTRDASRLEAFERQTDLPMVLLSAVFLGLLLLPWLWSGADHHERALSNTEWLIWGVFAAELAIRVALAPRRVRYLAAHWFDVVIVAVPFLRPLRILRGLRALGLLARFGTTLRRIFGRQGLQYAMVVGLSSVILAAAAVTATESQHEGAPIEGFSDALWWAVTTVTTVGYGDTYPVTAIGRGVGVALMIVGIAVFGVVTAAVAAYFVQEDDSPRQDDLLEVLQRIEARLLAIEARAEGQPAPSSDEATDPFRAAR